jgi:hypothetical protein
MRSILENPKVVEKQNIAIIDYSVEQATPISPPPYVKSSRGWFNPHEGLEYQIETERERERLRCEARKT